MRKGTLISIVSVIVVALGGSGYYFVSSNNAQKEETIKSFQTEVNEVVQKINKLVMTESENDNYKNFLDMSKKIIQDENFEKKEILIEEMKTFYDEISSKNKEELTKEFKKISETNLDKLNENNRNITKQLLKDIEKNINEANYIEAEKLIEKFNSEVKFAKENKNNEEVRKNLDKASSFLEKGKVNEAEKELNKIDENKLSHENKNAYNDIKTSLDTLKQLLSISGNYKYKELSSKGAEKASLELEVKVDKDGTINIKGKEKYVSEIKTEAGEFCLVDDLENEMLTNGTAVIKEADITGELKPKMDGKNKVENEFEGTFQKTGEQKSKGTLKYNGSSIEIFMYGRKITLKK